ncbi:MAG: toxin ParE1/3/4 [Thermomicrobiales bacterium]|nr:toxin ParE1/3/4 [Thermomicrobiales bacterium]
MQDIRRYTARQWGARQRDVYCARLNQGMRALLDHPERGHPRDELYLGCRSILVEQHIVYYYLGEDEIVVDRVLHGSQDATDKVTPCGGDGEDSAG